MRRLQEHSFLHDMNFKRYFYNQSNKQIKSEKIFPVTVIERKEYEFDKSFLNSLVKIKENLSKDEKLFPTDPKEQFASYQRFKSVGADESDEYMVKLAATMSKPEEPFLVKLSKLKLDPVVVPKVPKIQLSASGTASDEEFMAQLSATIPDPDKMKADQSTFFNAAKEESEQIFMAKLSETMSIISPSLLYSELLFSIDNLYMKNNKAKVEKPKKPEARKPRKSGLKKWFFDFRPDNEKESQEIDVIKTTREWKAYEFDPSFLKALNECMEKLRNDKDLFPDDPAARQIVEARFKSFGLYDEELFMAKLSETMTTIAPSLLYAENFFSLNRVGLVEEHNNAEFNEQDGQYCVEYDEDGKPYYLEFDEDGEPYYIEFDEEGGEPRYIKFDEEGEPYYVEIVPENIEEVEQEHELVEEEHELVEFPKSVKIFKHYLRTLAYVTETPEEEMLRTLKIYQPHVIPVEIEELGIVITELKDTVTQEEEDTDPDYDVDFVKWVDDYNEYLDNLERKK